MIEFASFTLLNGATQWDYWLKYLNALILSVLWNFTLNRRFTFRSAGNVPAPLQRRSCISCSFSCEANSE
ncbi:MAG: GtrA family protein [Lachnospiraceae bacterium]|nr:GtrA family protein [Lachnospiraceae bacterium]